MAHEANFVIIQKGQANAYYHKWAALDCINWFADGPEKARSVDGLKRVDWLSEFVFAEGGYLIDFDEKKAIVYGHTADVEGFKERPPPDPDSPFVQGGLAYLQHIGPNWVGWKLSWAQSGANAFAAHLRRRNITDISYGTCRYSPQTVEEIEYQA